MDDKDRKIAAGKEAATAFEAFGCLCFLLVVLAIILFVAATIWGC